jgi:hypothetical protein
MSRRKYTKEQRAAQLFRKAEQLDRKAAYIADIGNMSNSMHRREAARSRMEKASSDAASARDKALRLLRGE